MSDNYTRELARPPDDLIEVTPETETPEWDRTLSLHFTEADKGLMDRLIQLAHTGCVASIGIDLQVGDDLEKQEVLNPLDGDTVCAGCGSPDVQVQVWMHANSGETYDDAGGYAWCSSCEDTETCTAAEWAKEKVQREQEALRKELENEFGDEWRPCAVHKDCWMNSRTHEVASEADLRRRLNTGER